MPHDAAQLSSLPHYIRSLAGLDQRPALIEQHLYRGVTYSYGELMGKAFALEAELRRRGIKAGDRVMVWGVSGAAWAITYYGCILAGAVVVPLDAAFSASFAARVQQHTQAVLLCTDHEEELPVERMRFEQIARLAHARPGPAAAEPDPDTLLEIVYTSGATAEPKGVMITHGNLLANLRPIAREVGKYKPKAGLFLPLRFLHLIPLSHLFGQVMGLMIPPLLDSAVIHPESQAPAQWAALIRQYRASVVTAVPQQVRLFSQWAASEMQVGVEEAAAMGRSHGIMWSWWRWRRLHQRLGWKMWAFVVGGAALAPELEDFWNAMGYAVIQGYGLTETAPAIAITHPFKIQRGAVGRLLAGVETKLAPDGEILVRGGNVSPGYYQNPEATRQSFAGGWLHTGDLGRLDAEGNLHFVGRKKELIVTPDGLNVYPEDVERALNLQPAIADSAVVEQNHGSAGQIHAVVAPAPGVDRGGVEAAVAQANARLEPHQRVRAVSIWPQPQLPRTASTGKLQRVAIARWVNQEGGSAAGPAAAAAQTWREFAQKRWGIAAGRFSPPARLDADLGLTSLDRVELWTWLEAHSKVALDEYALAGAQTVADVDALAARAPGAQTAATEASASLSRVRAPAAESTPALLTSSARWPMSPALRCFRELAFPGVVFPFLWRAVSHLEVEGRERFAHLQRPLMLISNHQSLLDVPVILRAMPRAWRPWVAPAMGIDPLVDAIDARASSWRRRKALWRFFLLQAFFNAYLLTERGAIGRALRRTGELADRGYCPLIFPEGKRSPELQPFRPGIGVFVANLRLPVMVIRIDGVHDILPEGASKARRGTASVQFGPVFHFPKESPEEITARLESWYKIGN